MRATFFSKKKKKIIFKKDSESEDNNNDEFIQILIQTLELHSSLALLDGEDDNTII